MIAMDEKMWIPFRLDNRSFEWQLSDGKPGRLTVRSCDGRFEVQAVVRDGLVYAPSVVGCEFPPGCLVENVPFQLDWRYVEYPTHGIIHTHFVRALVGRWCYRRRWRRRNPLPVVGNTFEDNAQRYTLGESSVWDL